MNARLPVQRNGRGEAVVRERVDHHPLGNAGQSPALRLRGDDGDVQKVILVVVTTRGALRREF